MGAQQHPRAVLPLAEIERVVHLARRMLRRNIERAEIMEIVLDVRAVRDRETHVGEYGGEFLDHLADGMNAPHVLGALPDGLGDVGPFGFEARLEGRLVEDCLAGRYGVADPVLESVQRRAHDLALIRAHGAKPAHQVADAALFPQRRDADRLQRLFVGRAGDAGEQFPFKMFEAGHDLPSRALPPSPARKSCRGSGPRTAGEGRGM